MARNEGIICISIIVKLIAHSIDNEVSLKISREKMALIEIIYVLKQLLRAIEHQ